jgi:uncharacterized protein (DUF1501 family)
MANKPKKDISRLSTEQTLATISKIAQQFNARFHTGPSRTEMTTQDLRRYYQDMPANDKIQQINQMGIEQWDTHMDRIYNNG